ncbi:hypothetical protein RC62_75 [Flavobacterium aquidurense]|uniref:Uncharacterized protein n=1 Tax=Flavobacterium aquidurense TaxID=362413 RepID=A0A0Q0SFP7_9FLAO|nr:hypothetical protein RC62_75 [Flavobacterium aquidurense]
MDIAIINPIDQKINSKAFVWEFCNRKEGIIKVSQKIDL